MIFFFIIPLFIVAGILRLILPKKFKSIHKKHVVITGGSSGIGKCLGVLAAKKGANVTIIARNIERLSKACEEIKLATINNEQIIRQISVDVSNYRNVELKLKESEEISGPIYMLANCAGMAICGQLEDFSENDIKSLINVNFLGTLYPIKALIKKFKERREGIIVLTASQVALMGMFGYSIYSSCKFALRGFAESIAMELKPYNVSVTIALPPDTDTPGFENENKTKPKETKLISESGGLHEPDVVAERILDDALAGSFFSYIGFQSFILTTLCVGITSFNSYLELLIQAVLLGPLRVIGVYYLKTFHDIIRKCHIENKKDL